MSKILINDGLHSTGIQMLIDAGHTVVTDRVEQDELINQLPDYDGICVRSATKVREDVIKASANLKFIGRGGVGLDNIDVKFAESKGIEVINTPAASSRSVAELTFGHIFSIIRFIYKSNRHMPEEGMSDFKSLKKSFSKGSEVEGKKLGIIGFGRIGQEVARMGLGLGMEILAVDNDKTNPITITNKIGNQEIKTEITPISLYDMLAQADIITVHVPSTDKPVIGASELEKMKEGVVLINTARGGTINEADLIAAMDSGHVLAAGLDVFENEPTPSEDIIDHPSVSITPHIGASTEEAQERIGIELAEKIIKVLG